MPCNPLDLGCVGGQIVDSTAGRFLDELAEQSGKAAAEMLRTLVTGWLTIPTPGVSEDSGVVQHLRAYTGWAVAAVAVGSVLVAAIKLALERNGREAGTLGKNLVLLVVLAGAGVPAVSSLLYIGDQYADWILTGSTNDSLGERFMLFAPAAATSGLTALMTIGISFMVILASLVQLLMLLARNLGLLVLAGLLPLAGAVGGQLRNRYLAWLLALVLYKPAAATIYATVFWLVGEGKSLTDILTGLVGFCMALVALPALMRLIAPAVATLSSGGGGGAALAAGSAAGQVASGAVRLAGSKGGSGGGTASGGGLSRPGGSGASDPPYPPTRPSGGGSGPATAGSGSTSGAAGSGAAGAGAGTAGAGASGGAAAGAAGAGAAAAGPVGLAAVGVEKSAKAGPATVRKVGGTASGASGSEG